MKSLTSVTQIEKRIYIIRGHKVMLDSDLARLYGVEVGALVRAMKRNLERFPEDFQFRLTRPEVLRCQTGISNIGRGGRRYLPYAFTEQGVAMLSSVLRSRRASLVNIEIMRTFVRLREIVDSNKALSRKVSDLERKYGTHDGQIREIFMALRELMDPPAKPSRRIGFIKP